MKGIGIYLGIIIFIFFASNQLSAQFKKESKEPLEDHIVLYASCQYRELPGDWKVNYYGISGEDYFNNGWGMSGSFYFGMGSNNLGYLHVPPLGVGLMILLTIVDGASSKNIILLFFENLHYNFFVNDNVIISPYWNTLGADLGEQKGDADKGHVLFCTGIGISAKLGFASRLTFSPDLSLKYFFVDGRESFGYGNQFGFSATISLGYNL